MTVTLTVNEPSISVLSADENLSEINFLAPAEATPSCYSCSVVGIPLEEGCDDLLKMPLAIFVTTEDGEVHLENEELALFGCGKTFGEALSDIISSFSCTWIGLKDCSDTELTQDAIELRDRLAWYLGRSSDSKNG